MMSEQAKFYVYEHIRPDTGEVFYVGKGCGGRLTSTRPTHRNQRWLRTVAKVGAFSARKVVDRVDEELAFLIEMERIDQLRRLGARLCNITRGGEGAAGFRHSEEAKAKMRVKWRPGRVMSGEQRQQISEFNRGRRATAATRAKMSAAQTGRTHTPESRAKMSQAQRGKKPTPVTQETRKKLSAAHSGVNHPMWGKHHSEESKKKISDAKKGKPGSALGCKASPEARARMSEAQRGEKSYLFGTKQDKVTCPHCGQIGGARTMKRWHFDKCRAVPSPVGGECG